MISTVILTKNEATDLPACLQSLRWCDDVHVVDSGSTDETLHVALRGGAQIKSNRFESFGKQRNWALDHCDLKHEWVLFLDADECSTLEFERQLLQAVAAASGNVAGFYCCWKLMLEGRWLKRCDSFPKWQFRVVRKGCASFTDFGHGQKEHEVQGEIGYLREPYLHYAYSKGWTHWVAKHNRYSDLEARERLEAQVHWHDVFSRHGSVRNKALKPILSRVPGWPLAAFAFRYFIKLGFIEGRAGLIYCVNMAWYEFLIRIKMSELRRLAGAPRPEGA